MSKRTHESLGRMSQNAVTYPDKFYENQFGNNKPRSLVVGFTGRLALWIVRPELVFPDGQSIDEYQESIAGGPAIFTFTHGGKSRLHDPALALSAVYALPRVRERASEFAVWAAAPYLAERTTGGLIRRHGAVPVFREKDLPSKDDRRRINESLFHHSAEHVSAGGILVNFPAGTKGSEEVKAGIAKVAELAEGKMMNTGGYIVTVAMRSDNQEHGSVPRGAVVSFGEPIPFGGSNNQQRGASDFLNLIVVSQQYAQSRLPQAA